MDSRKGHSNEDDIICDFFGGSGTTSAVAEKLNRKWITCDIGKLAFYTIQKRILNIQFSAAIGNPKTKAIAKMAMPTTTNIINNMAIFGRVRIFNSNSWNLYLYGNLAGFGNLASYGNLYRILIVNISEDFYYIEKIAVGNPLSYGNLTSEEELAN